LFRQSGKLGSKGSDERSSGRIGSVKLISGVR